MKNISTGGMEAAESLQHEFIQTRWGKATIVRQVPEWLWGIWSEQTAENCFTHRYYQLLSSSLLEQFDHYYLLLEKGNGVYFIQPFFMVRQSILAGLPSFLRRTVGSLLRRWFPSWCEIRTLMVGCSAGESTLAGRKKDHRRVSLILHEALPEVARKLNASLVVFKDFPSRYRSALKFFSLNGYARIPSFPASKIDLRYRDFEDYMARTLSHKTRKNLRRKFREAEKLGGFRMELISDFAPVIDDIYPLYRQVMSRSQYHFEILTRDYFIGLASALGGRGRFFIWRDSRDKIVAFTLCILDGNTLRDSYIGLDYGIALEAHLYFITLRDIFIWAIEHRVDRYYSSPLNYAPKLHLKMELAPLDLYVCHVSPIINFFFRRIIPLLEPTRYDPFLPRFSNFKELR